MHGLSYIENPTKRKKDVSGNKNTTAGYIEKKPKELLSDLFLLIQLLIYKVIKHY